MYTTVYILRDSGTAWNSSPALAIVQLVVQGWTCSMQVAVIGANLLITCVMVSGVDLSSLWTGYRLPRVATMMCVDCAVDTAANLDRGTCGR